jgi:hypothetical protein
MGRESGIPSIFGVWKNAVALGKSGSVQPKHGTPTLGFEEC